MIEKQKKSENAERLERSAIVPQLSLFLLPMTVLLFGKVQSVFPLNGSLLPPLPRFPHPVSFYAFFSVFAMPLQRSFLLTNKLSLFALRVDFLL